MKKRILAGALLLIAGVVMLHSCQKQQASTAKTNYTAEIIPQSIAKKVAQKISANVLKNLHSNQVNRGSSVDIPNRPVENAIVLRDEHENPSLYVFNYTERQGFLVMSADLRHEPICAYIETGRFEEDTVPSMLIEWFNATMENIEMVRTGEYDNTERAYFAWYDLLYNTDLSNLIDEISKVAPDPTGFPDPDGGSGSCGNMTSTMKGPFLSTTWGQGCTYNEQCPPKGCSNVCFSNQSAWTGCVATAMNQLLRYWAHPNGFSYNYTSMPNNLGNGEVQRMMRDADNSVGMDYQCSGSGADPTKIAPAFKNTFGYSSASYSNYNVGSYMTVKQNLDKGWPVLLGGCNSRTNVFLGIFYSYDQCHEWVCDGYLQSQNSCYGYLSFHMNWGWHEAFSTNDFNGWYAFNLWNPSTRNYQYSKDFVYNIHP